MTREERLQVIRTLAKARWGSSLLDLPRKPRPMPEERGQAGRSHFIASQMIRTEPRMKWVKLTDKQVDDLLPPHERHEPHYLTTIARKLEEKPKRGA